MCALALRVSRDSQRICDRILAAWTLTLWLRIWISYAARLAWITSADPINPFGCSRNSVSRYLSRSWIWSIRSWRSLIVFEFNEFWQFHRSQTSLLDEQVQWAVAAQNLDLQLSIKIINCFQKTELQFNQKKQRQANASRGIKQSEPWLSNVCHSARLDRLCHGLFPLGSIFFLDWISKWEFNRTASDKPNQPCNLLLWYHCDTFSDRLCLVLSGTNRVAQLRTETLLYLVIEHWSKEQQPSMRKTKRKTFLHMISMI